MKNALSLTILTLAGFVMTLAVVIQPLDNISQNIALFLGSTLLAVITLYAPKINFLHLFGWCLYFVFHLNISVIIGILKGVKTTFEAAISDIIE